MADRTPAWREVYGRILDELIFRHTGWWAARDWLTQIGHDPDRANYPDLYRLLIPEHLWGDYDVPGWTANGIEPWGLQMDPIGADGNLFFKGFFLVMLGLHLRTTGDERWNDPFDIVRDGENTFTWFHSAIAEHLHDAVGSGTRTAATARTPRSGRTASPAPASACSSTTCCAAPTTTRCSRGGGTTCAATATCTSTATSSRRA